MSCEHYQSTLKEAAAGEVDAPLQQHLATCVDCRARFAEERFLFSAIDAGVSQMVNVEPGPFFVGKVSAALDGQAIGYAGSRQKFRLMWQVAAGLAIAACLVLLLIRRVHLQPRAESPSMISSSVPAIATEGSFGADRKPDVVATTRASLANAVHSSRRNRDSRRSALVANPGDAEVLVPPDERIAFAKFLERVPSHENETVALTHPAPSASPDLQIARLEVAPMIPRISKEE